MTGSCQPGSLTCLRLHRDNSPCEPCRRPASPPPHPLDVPAQHCMGTKSAPGTGTTPTTFQDIAVGSTTACSLPAPANSHRGGSTSSPSPGNSCVCYCRVGFRWISTVPDPAQRSRGAHEVLGKRGRERSGGSHQLCRSLVPHQPKPARKAQPQGAALHQGGGAGASGGKPGPASPFPQTTHARGAQRLLKRHYALLCLYASLASATGCHWGQIG